MTAQQIDDFSMPDEGELVAVDVDGATVAVTVLDGRLYAFDDTCPHAGCSLSEGELEDDTVVCPCHFARFDVATGAPVEGVAPCGIDVWAARFANGTLELDGPRTAAASADPPSPASTTSSSSSGPDTDITLLIRREHDSFRRQFDTLGDLSNLQELEKAWTSLADLLEIHASNEETVLYPMLVRAAQDTVHEAEHAVRDHNEIRHSVRAVTEHPTGSDSWWQAVRTAQQVNEEHLQEEEQDVLPPFRDSVDRQRRQQLGEQWIAFHREHEHAQGLSGQDTDPHAVVEQATPPTATP